eukprot:gene4958-5199_t
MLEALTPLSIISGAIMLFQTMHHTKCLPWMMGQIKNLSAGHPVAEVFLIGFAFAYLVEGASGFGTPPAAAGFAFWPTGAVGTPIWFGFGDLALGDDNLQIVGLKASILVGVCAFVIAPWAALFLVPFKELFRSIIFALLATATAVIPAIGISFFSYEFPSLIGGLISILLTAVLIKFKVGLFAVSPEYAAQQAAAAKALQDSVLDAESSKSIVVASGESVRSALRKSKSRSRHGKQSFPERSSCSASYSFVEDMGAVAHPPVPTLDFPLTNAPTRYRTARQKSFAAQADSQQIAAELAALDLSPSQNNVTQPDVESGIPGPFLQSLTDASPDQDKAQNARSPSPLQEVAAGAASGVSAIKPGVVQASKSVTDVSNGDKATTQHRAVTLRRSPSGHMELNPLDPDVAVTPRLSLYDVVFR